MAKRRKTNQRIIPDEGQPALASPFASLARLRDALPPGKAEEAPSPPASAEAPAFAPKVVLSRQRKGRGGKTVTVLSGVLVSGAARDAFIRDLGTALGANVRVEGDDIVVSGDQRVRARSWLEGRGVKRVIISG